MNTSLTNRIIATPADFHDCVRAWQQQGQRVGLVPTMGALHRGHMALVEASKKLADKVVVSIFVNPTQFAPHEDFDSYPRTLEADAALCAAHGVDALFVPSVVAIYPEGFATSVSIKGLGDYWCGASRIGHFDGVALIVAKLLLAAGADVACFGEKDFQQLTIIKRMVADLGIYTVIEAVPTYREADGLAMSSRNRYLTAEERQIAPMLYQQLSAVRDAILAGSDVSKATQAASDALLTAGFAKVDYFGLADAASLAPLYDYQRQPARLLAAAYLGKARLIDNLAVVA